MSWTPPTTTAARQADDDSDDRRTPRGLFLEIERRWGGGGFTIDGAATEANALCGRWVGPGGEHDNFLTWVPEPPEPERQERVWLNPPYSAIEPFVLHSRALVAEGYVERIVLLLPARTSTAWWQLALTGEAHFPRGRIRFETKSGTLDRPFEHSAIVVFAAPLIIASVNL